MMKICRFFRAVYHDNRIRRDERRRLLRDLALYARNRALRPVERRLVRRYRRDDLPVVFIVGVPRSGTTLLFQLMARHLDVGFPNNAVARYWLAPVYGARRDSRRRRTPAAGPLESRYGRTSGAGAPHELSWFWQHWLAPEDHDHLDGAELARRPGHVIRGELQGLAGFFGRPLVLKSLNYVDYHIRWLHALLPDARFVWVRREPCSVAQSILAVRAERYGDERVWWSVRPRDVADWRHRDPVEQVAHQIRDVSRAIADAWTALPAAARREVSYEALVASPRAELEALAAVTGAPLRDAEALTALRLENRNRRPLDRRRFAAIAQALEPAR